MSFSLPSLSNYPELEGTESLGRIYNERPAVCLSNYPELEGTERDARVLIVPRYLQRLSNYPELEGTGSLIRVAANAGRMMIKSQ